MKELLLGGNNSPYLTWSGPGEKQLVYGNRDLGVFGIVSSEELLTAQEIIDQLGSNFSQISKEIEWVKCIVKGIVLYIPKGVSSAFNVSWSTLYQSGLIYGQNNDGIVPDNIEPTNQYRWVEKDGFNLLVRTLSVYDEFEESDADKKLSSELNTVLSLISTFGKETNSVGFPKIPGNTLLSSYGDTSAHSKVKGPGSLSASLAISNIHTVIPISGNKIVTWFPILQLLRTQPELVTPKVNTRVRGLEPLLSIAIDSDLKDQGRIQRPDYVRVSSKALRPSEMNTVEELGRLGGNVYIVNNSKFIKSLSLFELEEIRGQE